MVFRMSGTLLRFTDYQQELVIDAPTLKEGIDQLIQQYPEVGKTLLDKMGQIRASHKVFVNGEAVDRADTNRPIGGKDIVDILTAVTGG